MKNSPKTEHDFFSFLKKNFSKEETIKLDYTFIPNEVSNNKLSRFYSSNVSIWFSRLKYGDNKIIYYFGSMEDEKLGENTKVLPRAIFYFDEDYRKSSIRFYKGDFLVLIDTLKHGEVYTELKNKSLKLMHGSKNKDSNRFYVILGGINSNKLIKNLDFFIKTFNFEMNLKSVIISIPSILKKDNIGDFNILDSNQNDNYYFDRLKFNLMIIDIKKNIKQSKLSVISGKKIINRIFDKNRDGDYYFNKNFKEKFDKSDVELLNDLNNCIVNLQNDSNICKKIMDVIQNDDEWIISVLDKSIISDDDSGSTVSDCVSSDVSIISDDDSGSTVSDMEFEFTTNLTSDLINEILSKINLNLSNFILKTNSYDDDSKIKLIDNLKCFTSQMMFKFNTKTLIDLERECIVKHIEMDISEDKIYGDIKSIVNFYVDQYKISKNKFFAFKYLNFYINSNLFNKLILEYNYSDNIVNKIVNRVKVDIEKNNLQYSDVETKFKIYFRSFESNKKYYVELENYRKDINAYKIRYNLTNSELSELFDKIESKIDDNNSYMDIKYIVIKDIENLVLDIKSDTCEYVNDLKLDKQLKLTESGCEKLKSYMRDLIYKDNLRISEITVDFLLDLRNKMQNNDNNIFDQEDCL